MLTVESLVKYLKMEGKSKNTSDSTLKKKTPLTFEYLLPSFFHHN